MTADEVDGTDLELVLRVNGEERTRARSSQMHHDWGALIAYASQACTLHPGEVLGSGTVPGGAGVESGRFLAPGDVVELEGAGIGVLSQPDRPRGPERHPAATPPWPCWGWPSPRSRCGRRSSASARSSSASATTSACRTAPRACSPTIPVLCMGIFAPPAAYLAARVGAARAVTVSLLLIGGFGLLRAGAPGAFAA